MIRIETTKSGEPRTLPYAALPALAEIIEHRREVTDAVQKKRGMVVDLRLPPQRRPDSILPQIVDGRMCRGRAWEGSQGCEGRLVERIAYRIPHDYRRSAARNVSRAGVPERVIMALCG